MEEKKRALAHIEKIAWIKPIEGADNIELVGVLGWKCIAKKGEFKEGDFCVYIEIDSQVPEIEVFEFLRTKHFKIKTMKLNKFKDEYGDGVVSQGIAIPVSNFPDSEQWTEGLDVTDTLGVTYADPEDTKRKSDPDSSEKYQGMQSRHKKIFKNKYVKKMMRYAWFRKVMFSLFGKKTDEPLKFPSWIHKTDEERIENLPKYLNDYDTLWERTEKIDGMSATYAMEKPKSKMFGKSEPELIVCSRNRRLREPSKDTMPDAYWEIAYRYELKHVLAKLIELYGAQYVILQGEVHGERIQGNPYKMDGIDFRAFNLEIWTGEGRRLTNESMTTVLRPFGVQTVPNLGVFQFSGEDMHKVKEMADGRSRLNENVKREGIVCRDISNPYRSFKNVSNSFLLSKR